MKITKIKTMMGNLGAPISVELDDIVERMQSPRSKEVADRVAAIALRSRLAMQQGAPRYILADANRLPYLVFSTTFKNRDLNKPYALTGLLMLNIPCPQGVSQISELRRRVSQIPYTLLAFAGISGVTLKVIVRCDCKNPKPTAEEEFIGFLRDAHENAARLYTSLVMCDLLVGEQTLTRGCRLSYDPQLYYNPEALPMPVVREAHDPLTVYEGTKADDQGTVVWYPNDDARQRIEMEFQTCLSQAIDDSGDQAEKCLQTLADYCHKAGLQEEGCVVRATWNARFKPLGNDLIRKVFRNSYKKPYNGKLMSQMNEKERIMRSIEDFLSRRYELRYNTVKQVTEFRPNDLRFRQWRPLSDRELKSIVVEEMKEGGESWMNDIRTYVESAHVEDYNPIHEFLAACGTWDRQHDYIEDFARRLPTNYVHWPKYFHRWFLAMVAQALDLNRDYGNSMVPMLIGEQGFQKTQFCNHILPPSMREYYMKDIKLDNPEQVERVLGRMWLVNIDEYDSKTQREQAKIKRLLTEKDVQVRKMRSDQYTMTPRLCSFIATTNDPTPLPSGDGTRRYLCIEVTGKVDMSGQIPYKQIFAQAVDELRNPDCVYWFTDVDEKEIQQHNGMYQQESALEMVLTQYFEPTTLSKRENYWTVSDIQRELGKQLKASDLPNLTNIGAAIKKLHWKQTKIKGVRGYYLKLK
jgi:predicted P-loop ATPase